MKNNNISYKIETLFNGIEKKMSKLNLNAAPLGQKSEYISTYTPSLLFPLPRQTKRDELNIEGLPFYGYDIWTAFELSWLNLKGKPQVALANFVLDAASSHFIESKSFKLYLNSFNQTKLESPEILKAHLISDLSKAIDSPVGVHLYDEQEAMALGVGCFEGTCIDALDVACHDYIVNPDLLKANLDVCVKETLVSHLLKSNCLVTGQPDWGSVQIEYEGPALDHKALLQYIVSFRNHNEFHEQCVERIFMDIQRKFNPIALKVYARYTRRGGLDINPIRSSYPIPVPKNQRLFRQ